MPSNKKIVCFIDSFTSGGAQKQMIMLANGLSKDMKVSTLQYHDLNFFSDELTVNLDQAVIHSSNKLFRIVKILKFLYEENPDCIISFLVGPNNYAALYKFLFWWRKPKLIVGERNLNLEDLKQQDLFKRFSHLIADKIVCNSQAQLKKLEKYFGDKLIFIPNGTNVGDIKIKEISKVPNKSWSFIVPARFTEQKNPLGLLKALKEVSEVSVYWYGEIFYQKPIYSECIKYLKENRLEDRFFFMPPTKDIYNTLIQYDALILPSFYEGCPNAIIDAMYSGLPVLASNVSDNEIYLDHQKDLIFDPHSTVDIINKILFFKTLSVGELRSIGQKNREMAARYFNSKKMVEQYRNLI